MVILLPARWPCVVLYRAPRDAPGWSTSRHQRRHRGRPEGAAHLGCGAGGRPTARRARRPVGRHRQPQSAPAPWPARDRLASSLTDGHHPRPDLAEGPGTAGTRACNPAFESFFGAREADLIGRTTSPSSIASWLSSSARTTARPLQADAPAPSKSLCLRAATAWFVRDGEDADARCRRAAGDRRRAGHARDITTAQRRSAEAPASGRSFVPAPS